MSGLFDPHLGRLTDRGRTIVHEHEARWSREAKFGITLEWLYREWDRFAQAVEAGYVGYCEEYVKDLDSRELLDEVIPALPAEDAATISRDIAASENTYRRATQPGEVFVRDDADDPWWRRRVPIRPLVEPM